MTTYLYFIPNAFALLLFANVVHRSMRYGKLSTIQNHVPVSVRPETSGQNQRDFGYVRGVRSDAERDKDNDNVK